MGLLGNFPDYGLLDPYRAKLARTMSHTGNYRNSIPDSAQVYVDRAARLAPLYDWANERTAIRAQQDNAPVGAVGAPGGILPSNLQEKIAEQVSAQQRQSAWDMASFATAPVPVLGDLVDLGAAANYSAANPGSGLGLGALGAAALIPGLPFALGTFGGRSAKTANQAAFDLADAMKAAGKSDDEILQATAALGQPIRTGFPDGMSRFEIDDTPMYLDDTSLQRSDALYPGAWDANAGDVIQHQGVKAAYPDLLDNPAYVADPNAGNPLSGGASGSWDGSVMRVGIQDNIDEGLREGYRNVLGADPNAKSTTLHELQHAIQQREGFARGGSPEAMADGALTLKYQIDDIQKQIDGLYDRIDSNPGDLLENVLRKDVDNLLAKRNSLLDEQVSIENAGMDAYRKLAGEAEARLAQNRMNLTADQRLVEPITHGSKYGFDVPEADQIVRRGDGVQQAQGRSGPYYRAGALAGGAPKGASAADVLRYEIDAGKDIPQEVIDNLAKYENVPADDLVWVGTNKSDMLEDYGPMGLEDIDDIADVTEEYAGWSKLAEDPSGTLLIRNPPQGKALPQADVIKRNGMWELSKIETPKGARGQGLADAKLQAILDEADAAGVPVALTPSSDFGASKAKLTAWYKRHGFVPNKGRNKDFTTRQTMIRPAKALPMDEASRKLPAIGAAGAGGLLMQDEQRPNSLRGLLDGAPKGTPKKPKKKTTITSARG